MEIQKVWEHVRATGYNVAAAASKAVKDVDILNSLMRMATSVMNVVQGFFSMVSSSLNLPNPIVALGAAFTTVYSFFTVRKTVVDFATIVTGEAANKNKLWGGPNWLAIIARASALVADVASTIVWLATVKIFPKISQTIGTIKLFGYQAAINLRDIADGANVLAAVTELTDNGRLIAEKGLSFDRLADVACSFSKAACIISSRVIPGVFGQITAGIFGVCIGTAYMVKWLNKAEWVKPAQAV